MGKCSECGKKILYNKYKMYRGKILCLECYSTRLDRKTAEKAIRKAKAEEVKIITPSKKAKKKAKKLGATMNVIHKIKLYDEDMGETENEKAEDTIPEDSG